MCGADLSKWGKTLLGYRGVFVLVISNINTGFQKSLTLPLMDPILSRLGKVHLSKSL